MSEGVMKFKKKPVIIEAIQITEKNFRSGAIKLFCPMAVPQSDFTIVIVTLEGSITASPLDWIIKGVNGEFYPCKPDIFEKTYERVTE